MISTNSPSPRLHNEFVELWEKITDDISEEDKLNHSYQEKLRVLGQYAAINHQEEKKFQKGSLPSDREKEILRLIKSGKDTRAIANTLNISTHTVDKHRKNMLERTDAKDTSCLIQICAAGNLI